jgi:hypothetical protein
VSGTNSELILDTVVFPNRRLRLFRKEADFAAFECSAKKSGRSETRLASVPGWMTTTVNPRDEPRCPTAKNECDWTMEIAMDQWQVVRNRPLNNLDEEEAHKAANKRHEHVTPSWNRFVGHLLCNDQK